MLFASPLFFFFQILFLNIYFLLWNETVKCRLNVSFVVWKAVYHTIRYVSSLTISPFSREFCIRPRRKIGHPSIFLCGKEKENKNILGTSAEYFYHDVRSHNFWIEIIYWLIVWVWIQFLYFGVGVNSLNCQMNS